MAKARMDGDIELDAPMSADKSVASTDIRSFGSIKGGPVTETTTGSALLKSLDFQDDEMDEEDNPLEDSSASSKPHNRFVMAKLVLLPEKNISQLTIGVNGKKCKFPLGKWVLAQSSMVASAKTTGELSFRNDPKAANKQLCQNHPRFQIQEIPDPWNTTEKIREFQAKVQAEKGKLIPFACETF